MRIRRLFLFPFLFLWVAAAAIASNDKPGPASGPGPGKVFLYTAKKLGIPVMKASLHIGTNLSLQGRPLYEIRAEIASVNTGLFFRMNNRFTSTFEQENCSPVQYIKEVDQAGLFREKKHYHQILTFDSERNRVLVAKVGEKEKQEISVPPGTFDPLSMFGRCYLKEDLHPNQEIRMTIYDGLKLRQMVFQPQQKKIKSKILGEVEAVCLEATTTFASFEDREGVIRIWYTMDGKRTPILMELDLPVGSITFELDEIKEG
jgi:hypothetical protein